MRKKGQVMIFIVLGIVILIITGLLIFLYSQTNLFIEREIILTPELEGIKKDIEECLDSTLVDAGRLVGIQGGYFIPPEDSLETDFAFVAYGYNRGDDVLINLREMEREIGLYIELFFPECFSVGDYTGYKIESGEFKPSVKIRDNFVYVNLDYFLSVYKGDEKYELNAFRAEIPVCLDEIYNVAGELVKMQEKNGNMIDFNYLGEGMYGVKVIPNDEKNFVYTITDIDSIVEGVPYTFVFAVRLK